MPLLESNFAPEGIDQPPKAAELFRADRTRRILQPPGCDLARLFRGSPLFSANHSRDLYQKSVLLSMMGRLSGDDQATDNSDGLMKRILLAEDDND
ncbi:hypothetical protein NY486_26215, partial [Enterobacter hormaechei]|nr:hypothetical protein [Enterobacter hormaechei]